MTDAVHNDADSADAEPQQAMLDHLRQLLGDALIDGRVTQGQIVIEVPVATVTNTLALASRRQLRRVQSALRPDGCRLPGTA